MVTKLSSRWPTRVLEFRNLTWSASSSDSIEWTRPDRVRPEERGWAFRSLGILWMRMADAFGWKAPLGRVRGSASALTPRRNIGWLQVAQASESVWQPRFPQVVFFVEALNLSCFNKSGNRKGMWKLIFATSHTDSSACVFLISVSANQSTESKTAQKAVWF